MLQLCVCRDIEHAGSLESTQEARVALGFASTLTPLSCSPNFPHAQYFDIRTLAHELIVKIITVLRSQLKLLPDSDIFRTVPKIRSKVFIYDPGDSKKKNQKHVCSAHTHWSICKRRDYITAPQCSTNSQTTTLKLYTGQI